MLIELLVIGTCAGKYECTNSTQAYYEYNKELKIMVERGSKQIEKLVDKTYHPYFIIAGAMGIVAMGNEGTIVFDKHFNLELKKDNVSYVNEGIAVYKYSF